MGNPNELKTEFVFDDKQARKVDALHKKILEVNNAFNNLGGSIVFGNTVDANAQLAGASVDKFKKKVKDSKTQLDAEFKKLTGDIGKSLSTDFNAAEKSADQLKRKLLLDAQADINRMRSETIAGEKAITRSIEREAKLQADIKIREQRRSANEFLTSLKNVDKLPGAVPAADSLKLSSFQKTNLGYQLNDIATQAALGQSPTQILASQGGQVAQIFSAEQIAAFTAKYSALLPILGAGTAALLLTYKVTGDIRAAAERRLNTEEKITSTLNKQRLEAEEIRKSFERQRKDAIETRRLQGYQEDTPIEQIRARKALLDNLLLKKSEVDVTVNGTTLKSDFETLSKESLALEQQIADFDRKRLLAARTSPDAAFDQRKADFRRNQQAELDAQATGFQRSIAYATSLKSETEKIVELQKIYSKIVNSSLSNETKFSFYEQVRDQIKQSVEKIKELKSEFRDFIGSSLQPDNQYVKVLSDIDTVGERVQKRFGALGDEFVKAAEKAERANLTKKLGLLQFQSQSDALRYNQEARRTAALQPTQFASFQRAVELVSKSVDFIASSGSLDRQIRESRFYADSYNPNNPKSFAEYNRRGMNDDISDFGVQMRAAVEDIKSLNAIGLQGTGVYGQGAIADRILSLIPSREELLKRLENPATRGEAQFLLNQQYGALTTKRNFEQTKFNDFVESQKNLEFNKQFAREQIALLDSQTGLDSAERARQLLNIVNPLGDDVDVNLQRRKYQANLEAGAAKRNEEKEALEAWKAAAKSTAEISEKLALIISENGVKIDPKNLPATNVNVTANDFTVTESSNQTPQNSDTAYFYGVADQL